MIWLGLDFETTGLDASKDSVTEVGAILWDMPKNAPLLFYHTFVDSGTLITPEIEAISGINNAMLYEYGRGEQVVAKELQDLIIKAQAICAHNAPFDRRFLIALFEKCGLSVPEIPWVDSAVDIPFPKQITTRKLTHLAAEHGFVNPFPHRAITDVLTMMRIVGGYDYKEISSFAGQPNISIRAKITYGEPHFEAYKEFAKSNGFKYHKTINDMTVNYWLKNIKENQFESEKEKCGKAGFDIEIMSK